MRTLLFPPQCICCRTLLPPFDGSDSVFCPLCRTAWETALAEAAERSSQDASRGMVYLTYYRSDRPANAPERLIHCLKHRKDPRAFRFVARCLAPRVLDAAERIPARAPSPDADRRLLFTYPPRRRSARRRNGLDQASCLAKALARSCGGEYATLIRRTRRPSGEQKWLGADGRMQNATDTYVLVPSAAETVRGRMVVICDDLRTTGATLDRCACLLVEAGARSVILATVAKTYFSREK